MNRSKSKGPILSQSQVKHESTRIIEQWKDDYLDGMDASEWVIRGLAMNNTQNVSRIRIERMLTRMQKHSTKGAIENVEGN